MNVVLNMDETQIFVTKNIRELIWNMKQKIFGFSTIFVKLTIILHAPKVSMQIPN